MINSRDLNQLLPQAKQCAERFLAACAADEFLKTQGIEVLVTSTYRDDESQAQLYAQGRTSSGKVVTNARPGQSFHNWRVAFDVVPLRFGKAVWTTTGDDGKVWERIGELGEASRLEWAGRWKRFREMAHFQYTGGLSLADLQAGKQLPANVA